MKNHPISTSIAAILIAFTSMAATAQTAASFPDKPVKFIIPFPPGGTLDKIGRLLALKLGEQGGQT